MYTFVYQNKKKYPKWVLPPLPYALAPFAQAIWEQIYLAYNWNKVSLKH